jgi:hypothetical protein
VTTSLILEQMMVGYQEGLRYPGRGPGEIKSHYSCSHAEAGIEAQVASSGVGRIEGVSATILIGKSFRPLSAPEKQEVDRLFGTERVQKLNTDLHGRHKNDAVRVRDAAYRVKGCGSLGRLRFALLQEIGSIVMARSVSALSILNKR